MATKKTTTTEKKVCPFCKGLRFVGGSPCVYHDDEGVEDRVQQPVEEVQVDEEKVTCVLPDGSTSVELQLPCCHLNGGGRSLEESYGTAYNAVCAALEAITHTYPHMRDYYPLPDADAALARAQDQQHDRFMRLVGVRDELFVLLSHCEEYRRNRERGR